MSSENIGDTSSISPLIDRPNGAGGSMQQPFQMVPTGDAATDSNLNGKNYNSYNFNKVQRMNILLTKNLKKIACIHYAN